MNKKNNKGELNKKGKIIENIKKLKNIKVNFTLVAIILIAIFCIAITPVTLQNDTYYTIKIGEYIKNFGIDMMDHFSWHDNLSYVYPHWLYDFCTYIIYSLFNFKGIYILTSILSVILGISIFFVTSKLTKNKSISFITTICALYMIQDYVAARAQLVTFILFIWTIYFIEKFIEKRKIKYGVLLILVSLLIANIHVAVWPFFFVLFLPYIGEYFIAILADCIIYKKITIMKLKNKIRKLSKKELNKEKVDILNKKLEDTINQISKVKIKREEENKNPYKIKIKRNKNVKWLILIMIICIFTGLLTPLGNTPYTYLYNTMQGNTTQNISEHLPMTLAKNVDVICTLVIFLAILIFTKTKIRLTDLFMITGLCYLMLLTRRQVSMFSLVGAIILTRLIVDMIQRYTKNGIEEAEKVSQNIGVVISLIILILTFSAYYFQPKLDDEFIDTKSYPVEACDYILDNINLDNVKFYNEYNYGSYMIFRGIPVFIDSRADLYSPEFSGNEDEDVFTDFINTSGLSKYYEETFEKYEITHVICYKKSKVNLIITKSKDKNYKELYSDDNFVIYERLNSNE